MKTNKSYSKRIRVTKHGKLIARKPGQGHFNAKESGNKTRAKRSTVILKLGQRARRRFFPGT